MNGRRAQRDEEMHQTALLSRAQNLALIRAPRPPLEQAAAELAELADGRSDLLTQAAGLQLGYNDPTAADWPQHLMVARVLIAAGADQALLEKWVLIGRNRRRDRFRDSDPLPDLAAICASVPVVAPPVRPTDVEDDRY